MKLSEQKTSLSDYWKDPRKQDEYKLYVDVVWVANTQPHAMNIYHNGILTNKM